MSVVEVPEQIATAAGVTEGKSDGNALITTMAPDDDGEVQGPAPTEATVYIPLLVERSKTV